MEYNEPHHSQMFPEVYNCHNIPLQSPPENSNWMVNELVLWRIVKEW